MTARALGWGTVAAVTPAALVVGPFARREGKAASGWSPRVDFTVR
jgi:hypothetical protein